jgi:hypothetical protein
MQLKIASSIKDLQLNIKINRIAFQVLTAVVMKSTIFWDTTTCGPLKVNRRFGGTYCDRLGRL